MTSDSYSVAARAITRGGIRSKQMEPIALSVADAIKISGLGKTTLYEAMADGRLEARLVGRKRLILTHSLRRLIEGEA
jgi:Helix-turn-helix domain